MLTLVIVGNFGGDSNRADAPPIPVFTSLERIEIGLTPHLGFLEVKIV
jgi:hypothetical protein